MISSIPRPKSFTTDAPRPCLPLQASSVWSNRGLTLSAMERHDESLSSFDAALRIMPDLPEALCNRSAPLSKLFRYDEALASCDRALALIELGRELREGRLQSADTAPGLPLRLGERLESLCGWQTYDRLLKQVTVALLEFRDQALTPADTVALERPH